MCKFLASPYLLISFALVINTKLLVISISFPQLDHSYQCGDRCIYGVKQKSFREPQHAKCESTFIRSQLQELITPGADNTSTILPGGDYCKRVLFFLWWV